LELGDESRTEEAEMARRNEARAGIQPWLEHLAWNAAAVAALAVMLLILLGSLEWLDRLTPATEKPRSLRTATGKPARILPALAGGGVQREACARPTIGSG